MIRFTTNIGGVTALTSCEMFAYKFRANLHTKFQVIVQGVGIAKMYLCIFITSISRGADAKHPERFLKKSAGKNRY